MLKTLEKHWPIISIIFTLVILASLFFWPGAARSLSLTVIGVGILAILTFTVRRHVQAHKQGRITRPVMTRNILVDVLGILITIAVVIFVAGRAGAYAGQAAGRAAESWRPGWGVPAGILSGLLAGMAAGFGVGLLVRWAWGKLTKPTLRQAQGGSGSAPSA